MIVLLLIHLWYDPECCNEKDCRPINCNEIINVNGGFNYRSIFFAKNKVKASQDGRCHACFNLGANDYFGGYCLYLPGVS